MVGLIPGRGEVNPIVSPVCCNTTQHHSYHMVSLLATSKCMFIHVLQFLSTVQEKSHKQKVDPSRCTYAMILHVII